MSTTAPTTAKDTRAVFFFDIDNCLYPRSTRVSEEMGRLITQFFTRHLSITPSDALMLHQQYYKDYGLAIEGLSRFHKVDPMEFNAEVDDMLPLDKLLRPDPEIRAVLERFDRAKVKLWLFTNAHVTHGRRVVRLLGLEDLFEGMTYCDYSAGRLVPKPKGGMYEKAEREAGVGGDTKVYYVDDSHLNCDAAYLRGWHDTVHLVEAGYPDLPKAECRYHISHLRELLDLFPELLRAPSS